MNFSDQVNHMVTTDAQLNKCEENRSSWLCLVNKETAAATVSRLHAVNEAVSDSISLSSSPSSSSSSSASPSPSPTPAHKFSSIYEAVQWASQGREEHCSNGHIADTLTTTSIPDSLRDAVHIQILCTGSLHLVGGFLGLVDPNLQLSMQ